MKNTIVYFPVCSDLLLIGTFEALPKAHNYTANQVTDANSVIASYCTKQIYAQNGDFKINLKNARNVTGNDLPSLMK